tara:strand:- start:956 stop:1132 length:177 start_codon:yes stop_codon:yes gene_type:complete
VALQDYETKEIRGCNLQDLPSVPNGKYYGLRGVGNGIGFTSPSRTEKLSPLAPMELHL